MPNKKTCRVALWGAAFSVAIVVVFHWEQALATTMRAYSLEDLVAESDLVIVGRAIDIRHHKSSRGKAIRSVDFKVDEYVIGTGPSQIVVRLSGGRIGNVRTRIMGEIEFAVDELVLLFVKKSLNLEQQVHFIVGMGQGRFCVLPDEQTGARFVTQMLEGVHLVDEVYGDPMGIGRSGVCVFVTLERFAARVRKIRGIKEYEAGK